jgi:glycosyltransferase involved in cell wall biosynthesis
MRILLGLTEVSGHYGSLKQGFRELGISATFWNLSGHPFAYGNEDNPFLVRWIRWVAARQKVATHFVIRDLLSVAQFVMRCVLLFWAICKFDVFIFGFNTSLLRLHDLPVLKLFGKKIIYQFHGSDSRPPYLDGSIYLPDHAFPVETCVAATKAKKRSLQTIGRYADVIIDNPTGAHFHERPIAIWLYVGLTSPAAIVEKVYGDASLSDVSLPRERGEDVARTPPAHAGGSPNHRFVRILHCPSNPVAKGTAHIEQAINRLKTKGHAIEFVKITGRPNEEVLRELRLCDFVVDQAYSDYAMPGLATEAAWFGKPLVIGGYSPDFWTDLMPTEDLPPSIFCHPDEMEAAIERLIVDVKHRQQSGMRVRQFVETHWQPTEVAKRYLQLLARNAPDHWWFDPGQVSYVQGCCAPESWIREMINKVVQSAGSNALMVSDKPELERLLIEFAKQSDQISQLSLPRASPSRLPKCA